MARSPRVSSGGRVGVWPPLAPTAWLRSPRKRAPFPLLEPGLQLYAFARQGLWHGLPAIGLRAGDAVLAPAWHHGSEIEALQQRGIDVVFYDGVVPDAADLDARRTPSTRALYLTHALGFPQDAPRWRAWCDERGLLLVEDCAQAWLATIEGRPVGSWGDLAVFCFYKSVGAPEGAGVLAPGVDLPSPVPSRRLGVRDHARRVGGWAASRVPPLGPIVESVRRSRPVTPEDDMALGDTDSAPWLGTSRLVRILGDERVAASRRANHRRLLELLPSRAVAPFDSVPEGASPFVFPLDTDDKEHDIARLAAVNVKAMDVWSTPHPLLDSREHPLATRLRERIVGLPVHHSLGPADIERMADAISAPAAAGSPALRVGALEEGDDDRWDELAATTGNVFATPAFVRIWARHAVTGRLELLGLRAADGSLAGVVALHIARRGPVTIARFAGHDVGDDLGPIHRPGDELRVADALRRHLASRDDWDVLVAEQVRAELGWPALLGARQLRREPSPVLRIDGASWDELLEHRSSNFRQQARRHTRNLERDHEVDLRLTADPDDLDRDLDLLLSLHRMRWQDGSEFPGRWEALHRDLAREALRRGWLRLWTVTLDGQPAAAWLGFRLGGVESFYQSGRDPRFDSARVGFVLLCHTIRAAAEDGMREYRFLRGDEDYKGRFTDLDPGVESFVLGRGPLGGAAALAAAGAAAMPAPFRSRLRGGLRR